MPAVRRTQGWRVSCNRCGQVSWLDASSSPTPEQIDSEGRTVGEVFRWRTDGNRRWAAFGGEFHSQCRECERLYRLERRAARAQLAGSAVARALGAGRQFGIELELIFPSEVSRYTIQEALAESGLSEWRVKSDGSLSGNGWEVVSPILAGDDGEEQVRKVCRVLNRLGATVNRSCGFHAHHNIADLSIDAIKRLARSWRANQSIIDGLVSESRRGDRASMYCRRLSEGDMRDIESCRDLSSLRNSYLDRYRTLNLNAYGRYGTVEVRQHQGTCDAEKILTWVQFGQALIDAAAQNEIPVTSRVRDLLSRINLGESAAAFLLGRAVQFDAVPV